MLFKKFGAKIVFPVLKRKKERNNFDEVTPKKKSTPFIPKIFRKFAA